MMISSTGLRVRKWLLMPICLAIAVAGHAAVDEGEVLTASEVFAEAPLEVLEMLRPSVRLDMLDYYTQADSLVTVVNALGGESRLEQVEPDYLKLSVSPVSTLEIKVLPLGRKQVVMTLYTVGGEDMAKDTEVRFFDSRLQPLETAKYIKAPDLADFFSLKGSGISDEELREKVPYAAVVYSTGPGDAPLTAALTTLDVLSQEDRDLLKPFQHPVLTARWKGAFKF